MSAPVAMLDRSLPSPRGVESAEFESFVDGLAERVERAIGRIGTPEQRGSFAQQVVLEAIAARWDAEDDVEIVASFNRMARTVRDVHRALRSLRIEAAGDAFPRELVSPSEIDRFSIRVAALAGYLEGAQHDAEHERQRHGRRAPNRSAAIAAEVAYGIAIAYNGILGRRPAYSGLKSTPFMRVCGIVGEAIGARISDGVMRRTPRRVVVAK